MNILYDHQTFSMQNYGGISRYFVELMKNMPQSYHCYNSVLFTENYYFINEDFPNKGIFFDTSNFNNLEKDFMTYSQDLLDYETSLNQDLSEKKKNVTNENARRIIDTNNAMIGSIQ